MSATQIAAVQTGNNATAKLAQKAPDSKTGDNFSQQLQHVEQHRQKAAEPASDKAQRDSATGDAAKGTAKKGSVAEGSVKEPASSGNTPPSVEEGGEGKDQLLQAIAERLAAGEAVEVTGVQPLQSGAANASAVLTEAGESVVGVPQTVLATAANLPQGGQSLPSGLPVKSSVAASGEVELPVLGSAAATSSTSPTTRLPEQAIANRPQLELPVNSEFSNQFRSEVATQKLDTVLPEGLRFSTTVEQPAGAGTQGAGLAAAGLSASALTPGAVPGTTTLADSSVPRPVISMNTPLGDPGWAQEVGSRLQVLVDRGNQRAEIRLNPPELGSVEVKVLNDGERTSVTFFAQNGATREALEAAMPRLREMFGESGLQLADANVSQQQTMADDKEQSDGGGSGFGGAEGEAGVEANEVAMTQVSNSLVDYYI